MKSVLVIEDTLEVRENICEILELSNYNVLSAENGKSGVRMALEHAPDLILCDVMMPELDGFGVLKILNGDKRTYDIPFIFLTAKAEKSDFRKGMGLGADDYITKPFDDVELLEAIRMRLSKSERLSSLSAESESELRTFFSEAKANEALSDLSENREIRNYQKKDIVYESGKTARWLFYVVSGSVKVIQTNDFGKELITHIYKPGQFFGYNSLISNVAYFNTAITIEDAKIKLIPKEDFSKLLFNQRDFAAKFIKLMASNVEETEQHLIDMAYSSVRYKVARAILDCLDPNEETNTITMSRDDLASLAGTAKETLIRTLSDFKKEGFLSIDGMNLTILNKSALLSIPQ